MNTHSPTSTPPLAPEIERELEAEARRCRDYICRDIAQQNRRHSRRVRSGSWS